MTDGQSMLDFNSFGYRERAVHPQDDWTAHACHFIHSANLSSDKREPNMTDTPEIHAAGSLGLGEGRQPQLAL